MEKLRKIYWEDMSQPTKRKSRTTNPIARLLKHFTPKRFKDKTKYNRKRDGKIWKRIVRKGNGDQD